MRKLGSWPLHLVGALVWGAVCGGVLLAPPWRNGRATSAALAVAHRHQEFLKQRAELLGVMEARFDDWSKNGRHTVQPVELPRLFHDLSRLCRQNGTRLLFVRQTGSTPLEGVPGARMITVELGIGGEFKALFDWLNGLASYRWTAMPESLQMEPSSIADVPLAVRLQLRVYVVDPAEVPAPHLRPDEIHRLLRSVQ